jgi:hypothetical protein
LSSTNQEYVGFYLPSFTTRAEFPVIESWFMACKKESPFVNAWKDEFMRIEMFDEIDTYIDELRRKGIDLQKIDNPVYLAIHSAAQCVLQTHSFDLMLYDAMKGPYRYLAPDWDSAKGLKRLCVDEDATDVPIVKLRGLERGVLKQQPKLLDCIKTRFLDRL